MKIYLDNAATTKMSKTALNTIVGDFPTARAAVIVAIKALELPTELWYN